MTERVLLNLCLSTELVQDTIVFKYSRELKDNLTIVCTDIVPLQNDDKHQRCVDWIWSFFYSSKERIDWLLCDGNGRGKNNSLLMILSRSPRCISNLTNVLKIPRDSPGSFGILAAELHCLRKSSIRREWECCKGFSHKSLLFLFSSSLRSLSLSSSVSCATLHYS